ncbi:MAG: hypothetical protein IH588_02740 [Anaerolineales bacterium]|nr:hypothetical protein [Anaerolineales bacterium]
MIENPLQPPPAPASANDVQSQTPDQAQDKSADRYKTFIVVMTLITTIVTAVVASLQADANIRSNIANRNSQYYAVLASGEVQRQGSKGSYDLNTMAEYLRLSQESLILQITALEQEDKGNQSDAAISDLVAAGAEARSEKVKSFSVFYTDPRYAPSTADGLPNTEAYLQDAFAKANEYTEIQNAAVDDYRLWSSKADSYVSVLTVLAVAFFLFGLAQALRGRMRLVFAAFGSVILLVSSAWTVLVLLMQ